MFNLMPVLSTFIFHKTRRASVCKPVLHMGCQMGTSKDEFETYQALTNQYYSLETVPLMQEEARVLEKEREGGWDIILLNLYGKLSI